MSRPPRPSREFICEVCNQPRRGNRKFQNICYSCCRKEPTSSCIRCGRLKLGVDAKTKLCPRCTDLLAQPQVVCTRCARSIPVSSQKEGLCKNCQKALRTRARTRELQIIVTCSVCGQPRYSVLQSRPICRKCRKAELNGKEICSQCKRLKVIVFRPEQLCMHCYADRIAPQALRKYAADYMTPFPDNKMFFDLLIAAVDWEQVRERTVRKFHTFGRFLQDHPLSNPLTWEAIEEALPDLPATNRNVPKLIRACLLDLGYLLAARGQLEARESYVSRRSALPSLKHISAPIQDILRRYSIWLWERKMVPANIRDHLDALASFWEWCEPRGIRALAEVQTVLLNNYLLTLTWQWRCSACQGILPFEPRQRKAPKVCPHCGVLHSFIQERRYAQNTIRGHRAKLFVFFSWAKFNHLAVTNPLRMRTPAPRPTIQHYPFEVLQQLSAYLITPDADPFEALSCYLIIFHGFSRWELQHVQLPSFVSLREDIPGPSLAEAYYLIVPSPPPSFGDRSPGRPSTRLELPLRAASWLKPLLKRFEQQRQQCHPNPNNHYLFVTPRSARHNTPVGREFIQHIIRRASQRVLGAECNPNTLRKTTGVLFAEQAGPGILQLMGWDDQQAFAYTWAERELIHPPKSENRDTVATSLSAGMMDFPSARGEVYLQLERKRSAEIPESGK